MPNLASQSRVALTSMASKTAPSRPGEPLMSRSTSDAAVCCFNASDSCSSASSRSRVSRATSVSSPEADELLWRTVFRVFALRLRALATLLLALERRRIAHPRQDYADFQSGITAENCDWRNGQ